MGALRRCEQLWRCRCIVAAGARGVAGARCRHLRGGAGASVRMNRGTPQPCASFSRSPNSLPAARTAPRMVFRLPGPKAASRSKMAAAWTRPGSPCSGAGPSEGAISCARGSLCTGNRSKHFATTGPHVSSNMPVARRSSGIYCACCLANQQPFNAALDTLNMASGTLATQQAGQAANARKNRLCTEQHNGIVYRGTSLGGGWLQGTRISRWSTKIGQSYTRHFAAAKVPNMLRKERQVQQPMPCGA